MMMRKKIVIVLVAVDLLLFVFSSIFFDIKVVYSTQIGYITSTIVMVASIMSYHRMVTTRIKHQVITMGDERDTIDTLEDPYDLYSEVVIDENQTLSETIKEEKHKLKASRRTLYQVLQDSRGALSLYRLTGYVLLMMGFFFLNRHGLLDIVSYIVSLGVPAVILVWVLMQEREK
jgi:protein-S-isoprenylcysteine O-methyltransferase Ste14